MKTQKPFFSLQNSAITSTIQFVWCAFPLQEEHTYTHKHTSGVITINNNAKKGVSSNTRKYTFNY